MSGSEKRGLKNDPASLSNSPLDSRELDEANRQLREANEQFQAIYEQGLFAGRLNLDGTVIDVNRASVEMCGFQRADVIGRPFWECGWWNRSTEVQDWVRQAVMQAVSGEPFRGESRYFWADGSEHIVDFACMPIKDAGGRVTVVVPTGMDITERVRAEENRLQRKSSADLEEANARLRREIEARKASSIVEARLGAIIESSDDAIVSKTLDGIITSWNAGAEALFGYTAAEAVGKSILLIVPPERHGEEADILRRLRKGERINHFETQRLAKDGRRVEISLSVSPVRDSTGTIVGASKIARDITDKKRIEREREHLLDAERNARAEAQRVNQLKDEFLATLSHELRTPLNAIMGWAQLMGLGSMNEDEMREAGRAIERNARTQKQLIEDLLDMSRIISGKLRLDVQQLEPVSVVETAIETIRPSAAVKEIRIEKILDPLAGPISGDPARLQQVVWNLLSNAVKFTPKGGKIQVRLERVNSHIEVSVSDTGQGIDPDFLPHLFERFRQADASTTRKHGGLGIGLAIVKEIVELHGGTVRAKSAGAGKGAVFVVILPILALKNAPNRYHPTAASDAPVDIGLIDLSGLKDPVCRRRGGCPGACEATARGMRGRRHSRRKRRASTRCGERMRARRHHQRHRHAGSGRLRVFAQAADEERCRGKSSRDCPHRFCPVGRSHPRLAGRVY